MQRSLLTGLNYINGVWQASLDGKTFEKASPNNPLDVLGVFPASGEEDVNLAVKAAKQAYPAWKATPAPARGELLVKVAQVLEKRKRVISREMTQEMGKSWVEAEGDIQEAIDMAYFVAGEGRRLHGYTTPSELPDKWAMTLRQPIGVCGLITPWNFPMAVPSWKIFPCLLAGNTAVFKPSEEAPLMGQRLVEIFEEVGLPKGVLNLVQGSGQRAGQALVNHPDVRLISFTGSSQTGASVAAACGAQLKRVALELGGKNACIVMDDADLDLAAQGIAWGAFGTSGQRCTATSRLLVQSSVQDALMQRLLVETEKLVVGDTTEGADIGPLIHEAHLNQVLSAIETARQEGARLRCGGQRLAQAGYFVAPTILDQVTPVMSIAQKEVFGPVLSVMSFERLEEALALANDVDFGLSSSIFTQNMSHAFKAVEGLEAGLTYVNAPSIGAEVHLPFGGVKRTGNGHREAGTAALDIFTEWKTVYIDYSGHLQKAQIDNHAEKESL
ncbi:MAG: aldehyde dehydrogenase family protein [Vampirovibrio sp.]